MKYLSLLFIPLMLSGCLKPEIQTRIGQTCKFNGNDVLITRIAVSRTSDKVVNEIIDSRNNKLLVNEILLRGCK